MANQSGAIKDFFVQLGFDPSEVIKGLNDLDKTMNSSLKGGTKSAQGSLKSLEKAYSSTLRRLSRMQDKFSLDSDRLGVSKAAGSKEYIKYDSDLSDVEALKNSPQTVQNLERLRKAIDNLQTSQQRLINKTRTMNKEFRVTGFVAKSSTDSLRNLARSYVSVFAAMGAAGSITHTAQELTSFQVALLGVSGDAKIAAQDFEFVKATSKGLGLNLTEATSSYGKLATAAVAAGLSMEQGREIFLATSELATSFNLSEADFEGVSRAMSQILSKGKLSTEELLQLGERVPIAFTSAAKALGVNTTELFAQIETGKIQSVDFAPEVVKEWRAYVRETGMLESSMKTSRNAMGAFRAAWLENIDEMSKAGFESGLHDFFRLLTTMMENMKPWFRVAGAFFGMILKVFSTIALVIQQLTRPLAIFFDSLIGGGEESIGVFNALGRAIAFVGAMLLFVPAQLEKFNDWLEGTNGLVKTLVSGLVAAGIAAALFTSKFGKLGALFALLSGGRLLTGILGALTKGGLSLGSKAAGAVGAKGAQSTVGGLAAKLAARRAAQAGLMTFGGPVGIAAGGAWMAYDAYSAYRDYKASQNSNTTNNNKIDINVSGVTDPKAVASEVNRQLSTTLKINGVAY